MTGLGRQLKLLNLTERVIDLPAFCTDPSVVAAFTDTYGCPGLWVVKIASGDRGLNLQNIGQILFENDRKFYLS